MAAFNPSRGEQLLLWLIAAAGLIGPNGLFIYCLLFQPGILQDALSNPVALAFVIDAMAATLLLAFLFARWRVSRLGWPWFLALGLLGGLLFAIPAFLLLRVPSTGDDGNHPK